MMDLIEQTSTHFSVNRHAEFARQAKLMILSGVMSPQDIATKLIEQFEVGPYGPKFKIQELHQLVTDDEFVEQFSSLQDDDWDEVLELIIAKQRGVR